MNVQLLTKSEVLTFKMYASYTEFLQLVYCNVEYTFQSVLSLALCESLNFALGLQ